MSVPSYITYIQNLNDEDLVEIVKDLIGLRMTGCLKEDSKFRDCVSAVLVTCNPQNDMYVFGEEEE